LIRRLLAAQAAFGTLLLFLTSLFARSAFARAEMQLVGDDTALAGHFVVPRILGLLAAAALVIAFVGVCAAVNNEVARDLKAVAIRRSLGAALPGMVWGVMAPVGLPVLIGTAIGILAFAATGQILQPFAYGVVSIDAVTLATAILVATTALGTGVLIATGRLRRVELTRALRDG
jgi:ABC-type antimicrobial peptide transport system permease subunit